MLSIEKQGGYLFTSAGKHLPAQDWMYIYAFNTHAGFCFLAYEVDMGNFYIGIRDIIENTLIWKKISLSNI